MFQTRTLWPALIVVGLLQSAALAWMVGERLSLLNTGREIVLKVIPADPRSLFRGDYVILNFDFSVIKSDKVPEKLKSNEQVFITLSRETDGSWAFSELSRSKPAHQGEDRVAIRGIVKSAWKNRKTNVSTVRIRCGIESYFVPEGTGKALEKQVRDRQMRAIIAVGANGVAAIKGLEIAGQRMVDPPLF